MFEKDWDLIWRILNKEHGWNPKSLLWLQQEHLKNKGWMLPFFGPDGRITTTISATELYSPGELRRSIIESSIYANITQTLYHDCNFRQSEAEVFAAVVSDTLVRLMDYLTVEEMVKNKILNDTIPETFGELRGIQIGMKVSKFVRLLFTTMLQAEQLPLMHAEIVDPPAWNHYVLGKLRNMGAEKAEELRAIIVELISQVFSMVLESLKIDDHKLVLSINPVDIIFASDYTEGWTSCYRLTGQRGAYSSAPISLLADGVTAIAYVFGKTIDGRQTKVKNSKINLKRWRAFVHFSPLESPYPTILVGRQYKSRNEAIAKKLASILAPMYTQIYGGDETIPQVTHHPNRNPRYANNTFVYSSDASTLFIYPSNVSGSRFSIPEVGVRNLYCVSCGVNKTENRTLLCSGCEQVACYHCNQYHPKSEMVPVTRGHYLCKDCYARFPQIIRRHCYLCGDIFTEANVHKTPQGFLCGKCHSIFEATCSSCGCVDSPNSMTRISAAEILCDDCLERWKKERKEKKDERMVEAI